MRDDSQAGVNLQEDTVTLYSLVDGYLWRGSVPNMLCLVVNRMDRPMEFLRVSKDLDCPPNNIFLKKWKKNYRYLTIFGKNSALYYYVDKIIIYVLMLLLAFW